MLGKNAAYHHKVTTFLTVFLGFPYFLSDSRSGLVTAL